MVTRSKSQAKSRAKPAAKRPEKKSVAKRASSKVLASANAKPRTADRDTLAKLRAHVDDIEKRLKRANSLTRNSVRALKTSYEVLDGNNHTTALTGHIEELSDRLTGMIEQTRKDVAHDLKIVLSDPRLETLSGALTKANQRLTSAEQNQAEAINAINTHIARLATAVDERMGREQRQREKGEALLNERMDTIEKDSAAAIVTIGEKVVSVSEDLTKKTQTLRGELAEQALTRQQDYEEHKHEIARRIEAIEDEQRNQLPTFERGITKLNIRMEALESNVGLYDRVAEPVISAIAAETALPNSQSEVLVDKQTGDAFAALELVDMQQNTHAGSPSAFVPEIVPEIVPEVVPEISEAPQPFAPVEYVASAVATASGGQNPEVFSPRAYAPSAQIEGQTDTQIQVDTQAQETVPPPLAVVDNGPQVYAQSRGTNTAPEAPVYSELPVHDQATPPPMPAANFPPMPDAGLPPMPNTAAVPEIQTLEPSMESVRPGGNPDAKPAKNKKGKAKKPKKNKGGSGEGGDHGMIRKVALYGGVAVVALFAYKTFAPKILGNDTDKPVSTQMATKKSLASVEVSGEFDALSTSEQAGEKMGEQTFESVEPVGDYSQGMSAPDLGNNGNEENSAQKQTLEAAAVNGNAIAQFQLGLSHLEAGREADAVRLIRLAANQGQAAAQYRLAKLYEAGIGVKVNGKTAKDLLTRAAKADNRIAMHDLGHYYATGADGASPDLQQAVKWFSMAAERGVLDSQFNLAVLYQGGSGVPLSLEDAYIWYSIAGSQGDEIAIQRSEAVARELSEESLAKAKARVKAFAPRPVNNAANGIFKNLPWMAEKEARRAPMTNPTVKGAQRMLASLGYSIGPPDGALGPNTRNAIIRFERANGLPETGRVNAALIERLQLAVGV
ncbi:MAG: peptidoglycan-binding protein [Robiginitomaculum sp.]|nr:peptidoglycan-binding protein [Robiginitomaculum sp.]